MVIHFWCGAHNLLNVPRGNNCPNIWGDSMIEPEQEVIDIFMDGLREIVSKFHGEIDPVYLIGAMEVIKMEVMMQDMVQDDMPIRLDS